MIRQGKINKKLLALILMSAFLYSWFPALGLERAGAGDPTPVRGKAQVMNTGDFLDFDQTYNSNVAISDPDPGNSNRRTMSGWAWDPGFGWINFGDALHGGPVTVDYATGALSGRAYFENTGGYIDFDNNNSNAYIDTTSGRFGGFGWSNDNGWIDFSNTGVYVEETGNPNAPTTASAYNNPAKEELLSGNWGSASTPYFEWSGAVDVSGDSGYASGIDGYWVYFGTTADANPTTAGAYQTESNYITPSAIPSGVTYYLRIVSQDIIGNRSAPATLFTYGYDGDAPEPPEYVNISPVGCSTASTFTFSWNKVTDPLSGTANYEYKTGSTGTVWSTSQTTIEAAPYQEGDNVFYVRTVDNAGNRSSWQTGVYCSTGIAYIIDGPTVTPGSSSIKVSWVSDKNTTGYVRVYEGNDYVSEQGHAEFSKSHEVKVIGLEPERNYRYKLVWLDSNGNLGESPWYQTSTTKAPQVYNLEVKPISTDTAIASWTTTDIASCKIEYGIGNFDNSVSIEGVGSSFSYMLSGLSGGTTYQFRVSAISAVDDTRFYAGKDFSTPPLPSISGLSFETSVENAAPQVKVSWSTNVDTTSSVFYRAQGQGSYKEISSSDKTKTHEVIIDNLADSTVYELYATGIDQYGNTARSDTNSFTTPLDSRPPKISDIIIETSNVGVGREDEAQIAVSWKTDEPSTSYVEYGEGISSDQYTAKTTEDPTQTNSHLVIVSGLKDAAPHHLRVCSTDKGNNTSCSKDNTVIPGQAPKSILTIILRALDNAFGWMKNII